MSKDFSSLKSSVRTDFSKLNEQINKLVTPQSGPQEDNRFWTSQVDKAGNGYAVIRFLPQPAGEDVPFVRIFNHGFKGPNNQWLIEKCLTTVGEKCPVCEHNSALWGTGTKENQEKVRNQKRKLSFISNIYVVKDPANPENEGKVMLFKYGKKIFDKLNAAMNPEFEDEQPMNPFDLWGGANFKLKIRKVEGYQNYDKSEFEDAGPLNEDDEVLEKIWKSEYSLQEFVARSEFKSYDDIKARLNKVLAIESVVSQDDDPPWEEDAEVVSRPVAKPKTLPPKKEVKNEDWDEVGDMDLEMFKKLVDD
jgi:hypothetical protein